MHDKNTKIKVFIDGSAGTTGLRIRERLSAREDVTLLPIEEEKRKELSERLRLMNEADVAFLCLPDDAAREIADASPDTVLIDTSTAHRTKAGWSYGFPELSEKHRSAISGGRRIAVPGCHAGGFISLIYPLRAAGRFAGGFPCDLLFGHRLQRRRKKDDRRIRKRREGSRVGFSEAVRTFPNAQASAGDAGQSAAYRRACFLPHCRRFLQWHGGNGAAASGEFARGNDKGKNQRDPCRPLCRCEARSCTGIL